MVKCGIKRYDDLPARIGKIDVDILRFGLSKADNNLKKALRQKVDIQARLEKVIRDLKVEQGY